MFFLNSVYFLSLARTPLPSVYSLSIRVSKKKISNTLFFAFKLE